MDFIIKSNDTNKSPTPVTNGITTSRTYKLGIQVDIQRKSICDSVVGGCPVPPGEVYSIDKTSLPRFAMRGEYKVISRTVDRDGVLISCVEWSFEVN